MSSWDRKKVIRGGIAALFVVALLVLLTIGLKSLFSHAEDGQSWASAVAAVSTIVLVAVTTIYVVFTGSMVRLQGEANLQTKKLEASRVVRSVMESIYPTQQKLRKIKLRFPIDESKPPVVQKYEFANEEMASSVDYLRGMVPQLPPELASVARVTVHRMADATLSTLAITNGLHRARTKLLEDEVETLEEEVEVLEANTSNLEARKVDAQKLEKRARKPGKRVLSWADVRAGFYEEEETRAAIGINRDKLPEWSDIVSGRYIDEAFDALQSLERDFSQWLMKQ